MDKTVKLPTLSTRRNDLCKKYVKGMKQSKHKLNHLLPETRDVPYLRSVNKYPLVKANTNRYKNGHQITGSRIFSMLVFICLSCVLLMFY